MGDASHIVVDWGTSSFRLWALDGDGQVLAERRSAQGLAVSAAEGFENVLESHLQALAIPEGVPVMMCGMVGSRTGWVEAPYVDTPAGLDRLAGRAADVPSGWRPIRILPGIAQRGAEGADVMRGEETQLLSLIGDGYEGLCCLPGTHSKWVVVGRGQVQRFATFMTGELFHLLRSGSIVAAAVEAAVPVDPQSAAFAKAVEDGLAAPETLASQLFRLRASWLLEDTAADDTLARLSGLLVGTELAGAARHFGTLDPVALIASGPAAEIYRTALAIAGVPRVIPYDAEELVRAGLHAAACAAFPLEEASA